MLYFWKYKNSKFAQIWAYLDYGKCFQDAPDLTQLQPGLVAKDKQIRQKASLFGEWLTYRTIFHLVLSMLVNCESWLVIKKCTV